MSWFSILKKLTGKAKSKGSTLDTDRIKINIKDDCKEKLRKLIWFNTTEPAPDDIAQQAGNGDTLIDTKEFNKLPEQIACETLQALKSLDLDNPVYVNFPDTKNGWVLQRIYFEKLGKNYALWVGVDFEPSRSKRIDFMEGDIIRVYIINKDAAGRYVAWVRFPFSDIKKWNDAL